MDIKEFEQSLKVTFCKLNSIMDVKKINEKLFNHWVFKRLYKKETASLYDLNDIDNNELIEECVKWYYLYGNNSTIDELLDYKDKIITCTFRLSQHLSELIEKHENKIADNKSKIAQSFNKFSADNLPTAAKEKARLSLKNPLQVEAQYKGEIKSIETILSSLDKVVSAMTQRIAWYRQEYDRSRQS